MPTFWIKIIKKTRFPHWGETLELDLDPEEMSEEGAVTVEVWDWDMVGRNDFLGKVRDTRQHKYIKLINLRFNVCGTPCDLNPGITSPR